MGVAAPALGAAVKEPGRRKCARFRARIGREAATDRLGPLVPALLHPDAARLPIASRRTLDQRNT